MVYRYNTRFGQCANPLVNYLDLLVDQVLRLCPVPLECLSLQWFGQVRLLALQIEVDIKISRSRFRLQPSTNLDKTKFIVENVFSEYSV